MWNEHYVNALFNVTSLAVSPGGRKLFATGDDFRVNLPSDLGTLAYDAATGAKLWARSKNGPGDGEDGGIAITVHPDGSRVFVTGKSDGGATGLDYLTIAYAA